MSNTISVKEGIGYSASLSPNIIILSSENQYQKKASYFATKRML